jgi:hypothetical protein
MLDECAALVLQLQRHGSEARDRAREPVVDGYPSRSMPESDIHGTRVSDPVLDLIVAIEEGRVTDPIGAAVRRMERELEDARQRLKGAVAALQLAMPVRIPDAVAEVCVECGVNRRVARGWVAGEARCGACSRRLRRHAKAV